MFIDSEIETILSQLDTYKDIFTPLKNNYFEKELFYYDLLQEDNNNAPPVRQTANEEVEQNLSEFLSFAPKPNVMDTVPLVETHPENLQEETNYVDALKNEVLDSIINEDYLQGRIYFFESKLSKLKRVN